MGTPSSRRRGGAKGRPPSQQRHGCDSAAVGARRPTLPLFACERFPALAMMTVMNEPDTTAQERSSLTPPRALVACAAGLGILLLLAGGVVLVIPNAVHVDVPTFGSDIFFDCGGALYPGSRPAEEPGISAWADLNRTMLRCGLVLTLVGAVTALTALWLLRRRAEWPARELPHLPRSARCRADARILLGTPHGAVCRIAACDPSTIWWARLRRSM
jgi:hypothetical protein